jgi:hypothetical protein
MNQMMARRREGAAMSKYEALPQFLAGLKGATHRLSFRQVERVLGFKLPESAYEYEAWWSNNGRGHSHARAWIEAGWRTEAVDLAGKVVTFSRSAASLKRAGSRQRDPWGCMAGTITILPGTDLTQPADDKWDAEEGRLLNE